MSNSEKLILVFSEALGVEKDKISDDLKYNSIEEWDSVAHMNLVAQIEDAFDVMLDTDEIIDLSSVKKAKEILAKHGIKF